uniref:ARF GTPase-activating protein GIT1 C-terminal domain-containing protein n=1 Tax=Caenorhabditis japonica TaxID=281687 RepID=A0A8R1E339_CAEJA
MEKRVERRQDSMMESSSSLSRSSQNPSLNRDEIRNRVIQQGERITILIRALLQHGQNGNLDLNASHNAHEIACAINGLIAILLPYVRHEKIDMLTDAVVLLNAKCNSPLLMPMDIKDAAQTIAEKLHLIIMDFR